MTCLHREGNHVIILLLRIDVDINCGFAAYRSSISQQKRDYSQSMLILVDFFAEETLDARNAFKIVQLYKFNNLIASRGRARKFVVTALSTAKTAMDL